MPVLNDTTGAPIGVTGNPLVVSGDLQLDSAVEIVNDVGNPIPVSGTIELGSTSLAALENTTVTVGNFPATQPVSGSVSVSNQVAQPLTDTQLRAVNVAVNANQVGTWSVNSTQSGSWTVAQSGVWNVNASQSGAWSVGIDNFPASQATTVTNTVGTTLVSGVGTSDNTPIYTQPKALTLAISSVGAAAAAVTVTLPAAGAGLFHYIDTIEITLFNSAARTGSATPVTVTSTNLPSAVAWTFPSAGVIGAVDRYALSSNRPLRSATANAATTIVCPATTGVVWRVNVTYSVGV